MKENDVVQSAIQLANSGYTTNAPPPPEFTLIVAQAAEHKVVSCTFSPKSHVAAMPCCQVSKTESLNSIYDVARANETLWTSMGVAVPRRNTLSNANAVRPAAMAKDLYWKTFSHLVGIAPKFGKGPHRGYCFRIKAPMFAVDSSTVRLTMNSFDWARHRRKKAAAKLHLTFDLGSRLPSFAIVEDAAHHDSVRAAELTAHLSAGDVAVADRAYADFGFMDGLDARGVRFVTRQKRNMRLRGVKRLMDPVASTPGKTTQILADEVVVPERNSSADKYRGTLRRVTAMVETLQLHGTASPVKSPAVKPKRLVFQLVLDFAPAGMGQQTC